MGIALNLRPMSITLVAAMVFATAALLIDFGHTPKAEACDEPEQCVAGAAIIVVADLTGAAALLACKFCPAAVWYNEVVVAPATATGLYLMFSAGAAEASQIGNGDGAGGGGGSSW